MNPFFSSLLFLAQEAPGPAPEPPSPFNFTFVLTMLVIVAAFYMLIGTPKRKAEAAKLKAVEQMKRGTRVISAGGIHGKVVKVDTDKNTVVVEVAKGVEMTFNKSSINIAEEPKAEEEKK